MLIIEKESKVIYLIPSNELSQTNSNIFIDNEISLMPSLSNREIKVSINTIPELVKYSLENMIDELKS